MSWPVTIPELETLGQEILADADGAIVSADITFGELTLTGPAGRITQALTYLRDVQGFHQLIDLCGVDYPEREKRFDVVYHLLSMTHNRRIRIKVQTDEDTAVPSVVEVFSAADWFEREAFDMYGIFFEGPPRPAPDPYGLRLPRPSAAEGLPHDRLRRGSLRRRAEAGGLRACEVRRVAQLGFPVARGKARRSGFARAAAG
jgi:NADH:ubiquinone oxidoreductase subunit C